MHCLCALMYILGLHRLPHPAGLQVLAVKTCTLVCLDLSIQLLLHCSSPVSTYPHSALVVISHYWRLLLLLSATTQPTHPACSYSQSTLMGVCTTATEFVQQLPAPTVYSQSLATGLVCTQPLPGQSSLMPTAAILLPCTQPSVPARAVSAGTLSSGLQPLSMSTTVVHSAAPQPVATQPGLMHSMMPGLPALSLLSFSPCLHIPPVYSLLTLSCQHHSLCLSLGESTQPPQPSVPARAVPVGTLSSGFIDFNCCCTLFCPSACCYPAWTHAFT